MSAGETPSLEQQRQGVRERLQAQRGRIAQLMLPETQPHDGYPRSMLMRLLVRRPELVATILAFLVSRLLRRRRASPPSAPI